MSDMVLRDMVLVNIEESFSTCKQQELKYRKTRSLLENNNYSSAFTNGKASFTKAKNLLNIHTEWPYQRMFQPPPTALEGDS